MKKAFTFIERFYTKWQEDQKNIISIEERKIFSLLFAFLTIAFPTIAQDSKADLIIYNANIHTMDKALPQTEAVAVSAGKIIAVGSSKKVLSLSDENTRKINAGGKLMLPGFNDAHVHFMGIGNIFSSINLSDAKSSREITEKISYYAQFLPENRWIQGTGLNISNWDSNLPPTKETLDAITPDNPVFIYYSDNKKVLVNSLALKMAGIRRDNYLENKFIERDATGDPTGIIKDSAIEIVRRIIPKNSTQNWLELAETATNYAASLGVTSVQDVHSDDLTEIYRKLLQSGKLKTRIYDCYYLPDWEKLARTKISRATGDAMIRSGCLKFFSEGDYNELPKLSATILAADKADLQIMMHAIGNAANDIVLTIYERVIEENGRKDRRFRVEHAYNFRSSDLKRFSNSKIIPSLQPHLFDGDEPYRVFLKTGAVLAFGSDASITDFNALFGIHAAVNSSNMTGGVKQALTVNEAVYAYTAGAAYAEFQEKIKGAITVGKLADLIILSDDIFEINPARIKNTRVLKTIVGGNVVFEAD